MADGNGNGHWRVVALGAASVIIAALGAITWQGVINGQRITAVERDNAAAMRELVELSHRVDHAFELIERSCR